MKINVLVDNHALRDYKAEWGLSMFIEFNGKSVLLDFGSSQLYLENAKKLGLDILNADYFVLSHGHWDHGDGLKYLPKRELICHPDVFIKRYNVGEKYIGLPYDYDEANKKFNLKLSKDAFEIFEDAYFLGEIPRVTEFESKGVGHTKEDGSQDLVYDDSGVVFNTDKGIIVISGCAHAGICNTIEHAKKITNNENVYAVLGGFHLKGRDEVTKKTIEYLKKLNIEYISTSHCTRFPALVQFANAFGSEPFESGQVIEL